MKTPKEIVEDYAYGVAGSVWLVPALHLTVIDGEQGISQREIDRVHRAIVNEICGERADLTYQELAFLCDVTGTPLAEIARFVEEPSLRRWAKRGAVPRGIFSDVLKRRLWFVLFGDAMQGETLPFDLTRNDRSLLRHLCERAKTSKLADEVKRGAV